MAGSKTFKKMMKHTQKMIVLMVLLAVLCMFPISRGHAENIEMAMEEVSFSAEDGGDVSGSWIVPLPPEGNKRTRWPVVILLHDYGMNRRDWNVLIPELIQAHFAVLALDLRGHGSEGNYGGTSSSGSAEYALESGLFDIGAALSWLKAQKKADEKRVAIVGVGIGAEIAYLSSGTFKKNIQASVVICPSYSAVLDGKFAAVEPKGVLFCSASKSQQGMAMMAAQTLANFTKEPKRILEYNSAACGMAMFYKHPGVKRAILDWVAKLRKK